MNTISESIPIELVREIIRKRNELSDETFQIHINQKGEQYISLNRSSKYVKSVTKSLETMADCLRHHSQLTYLLKYAQEWDDSSGGYGSSSDEGGGVWGELGPPLEKVRAWMEMAETYNTGMIGGAHYPLGMGSSDRDIIERVLDREITYLAKRLSVLCKESENMVIEAAIKMVDLDLEQYLRSLYSDVVWESLLGRSRRMRLELEYENKTV